MTPNEIGFRRILASLLDARGRASRLEFYIIYLGWGVYSGVIAAVVGQAWLRAEASGLFMVLLLVPGLIIAVLAMIRRLHDRGHSGWVLLLTYALPGVAFGLTMVAASIDNGAFAVIGFCLFYASMPVVFWLLVELFVLRGVSGSNRFGPDPLAGEMAAQ